MAEFIGSSARRCPARPAVKPSRQRSTCAARTVPCGVTARPGSIAVTRVCSWMVTPSRRTTPARPCTSRAGCTRAQSGSTYPPRAPATSIRSVISGPVSSRAGASGGLSRIRASWAGDRATCTTPLRRMSASMPSSSQIAITSSTVRPQRRGEPVDAGRAVWTAGEGAAVAGQLRGQPAAVAARGAEADELRLEDHDPQRRVGHRQVVGGPQPGEPTADDADVALEVAGERRSGLWQTDLGVPERHTAVGNACGLDDVMPRHSRGFTVAGESSVRPELRASASFTTNGDLPAAAVILTRSRKVADSET